MNVCVFGALGENAQEKRLERNKLITWPKGDGKKWSNISSVLQLMREKDIKERSREGEREKKKKIRKNEKKRRGDSRTYI